MYGGNRHQNAPPKSNNNNNNNNKDNNNNKKDNNRKRIKYDRQFLPRIRGSVLLLSAVVTSESSLKIVTRPAVLLQNGLV